VEDTDQANSEAYETLCNTMPRMMTEIFSPFGMKAEVKMTFKTLVYLHYF